MREVYRVGVFGIKRTPSLSCHETTTASDEQAATQIQTQKIVSIAICPAYNLSMPIPFAEYAARVQ
ncbi:MAG TPA: hypothetical protein VN223_10825, partial [Candidatus Elarobacter sp.]|nr:hypothetical protein [Candidatus Elarobacter sp.]